MLEPVVDISGVKFGYRTGPRLFHAISMQIHSGSVVGLLGRNGAGKTSLLKIAAGALFPQAGTATLFGHPAAHRDPRGLARMFFVPEQIQVPPLTVARFLETTGGYYPRFDSDQLQECLARFEICPGMDVDHGADLRDISSGQQKKIMLALAFAAGADLVILDEPTNGLDIPAKQVFRDLVERSRRDGCAVVISTHQVRDVENTIDRVVILEGGEILFHAPVASVAKVLGTASFESRDAALEAGALAVQSGPAGDARALIPVVPHGAAPGTDAAADTAAYGTATAPELELLFQAAVSRPGELRELCGVES